MTITLRDGTTVEDPRLGRIAVPNPAAVAAYPIRGLLTTEQQDVTTTVWPTGPRLNQGEEGACVGFGWTAELMADPSPVRGAGQDTARPLYYELQRRDQFDGGEYPGADPRQGGTSVEEGAKLLTEVGHYREYRWARTEKDIALAVSHHGPVVIGVNWYAGMRDVNRKGFIRPTGRLLGGHCVLVFAVDAENDYYTIQNSWGRDWGIEGICYLSRYHMAKLLRQDGEACLPVRTGLAQYAGPTS